MAVLDFPASPTVGQVATLTNGFTYQWDGAVWTLAAATGQQAGGDLTGTYPNPTLTAAAKSKWTVAGTTITPTDAAKAVALAPIRGALAWKTTTAVNGRLDQSGNATQLTTNLQGSGTALDDTTLGAWAMTLDPAEATIGTVSLWRAPATAGAPSFTRVFMHDGSGNLTITGPTATKASGTTWANPSDPRLKRAVGSYDAGLAQITRLDPIMFKYNGLGETVDDDRQCYGLDASAVQPVMPECVGARAAKLHPDDVTETTLLTLDASCIIWALVNAVKELSARVAALGG